MRSQFIREAIALKHDMSSVEDKMDAVLQVVNDIRSNMQNISYEPAKTTKEVNHENLINDAIESSMGAFF